MNKIRRINHAEVALAQSLNTDFTHHSVNFNIKRYFTDVNGVIQSNAAISAAAPALATKYPCFILSEFDRQGGYKQGLNAVPPMDGTYYLTSGVNGFGWSSFSVLGFTGLNQIQGLLKVGDLVHVYVDSLSAPTYFVWIVASSAIVSLASITSNTKTTQKDDKFERLWVEEIHYTTLPVDPTFQQFREIIREIRLNNIGLMKTDDFNPFGQYETPMTYLQNILILPWRFKVDQYLGYGTYIQFNTTEMQFILKMLK